MININNVVEMSSRRSTSKDVWVCALEVIVAGLGNCLFAVNGFTSLEDVVEFAQEQLKLQRVWQDKDGIEYTLLHASVVQNEVLVGALLPIYNVNVMDI